MEGETVTVSQVALRLHVTLALDSKWPQGRLRQRAFAIFAPTNAMPSFYYVFKR